MVNDRASDDELDALRRRVEALERALRRKSRQIAMLLDRMPAERYPDARRILEGRPLEARLARQPGDWEESTELVPADVEEVLTDLWAATRRDDGEGGA